MTHLDTNCHFRINQVHSLRFTAVQQMSTDLTLYVSRRKGMRAGTLAAHYKGSTSQRTMIVRKHCLRDGVDGLRQRELFNRPYHRYARRAQQHIKDPTFQCLVQVSCINFQNVPIADHGNLLIQSLQDNAQIAAQGFDQSHAHRP